MRARVLVILASLMFPSAALAAGGASPGHDPSNIVGISEAMEAIVDGDVKYVAKDFAGAMESYKKATKLQPKNPLGHFRVGQVHLQSGNFEGAETAWTQADSVADALPQTKAKVLYALADLRERMKKWDDAKTAWQRYGEYVAKHPDSGFGPTAAARALAIDDMVKQDKAYVVVRERIAAEKAEKNAPAKTAPAAAPAPKK
ncbi:MAG: tetratricopeptide repeat protein [Polyangiaceae bacterium]